MLGVKESAVLRKDCCQDFENLAFTNEGGRGKLACVGLFSCSEMT